MKRILLTFLVLTMGGLGSLAYLAALCFRVDPPELEETQLIDGFIGVILGLAVTGIFHLIQFPRAATARAYSSIFAGLVVCLFAAGTLIYWHRYGLEVRLRNAKALQGQTNPPAPSALLPAVPPGQ